MAVLPAVFLRSVCLGIALVVTASPAHAQSSFKVGEKEVQVHGSIQQGFVVSGGNNFLTMKTSDGSGAMTDSAFNLSTQLTRKLRVGGQLYSRNIGELGNGEVQVDWVFADYKFSDTFGVRAGKVKTPLGLYNDTQDMEFLYTWALLPQGVYPLDLRGVSIAHLGVDVYGTLRLAKAGSLQYTVYGGTVPDDERGGYRYGWEDSGLEFLAPVTKHGFGTDLRWETPVEGLMVGYSMMNAEARLELVLPPSETLPFSIPVVVNVPTWRHQAIFGDYQKNALRVSAEWRIDTLYGEIVPAIAPPTNLDSASWLLAAAYRLTDRFEVGAYRSQYIADTAFPAATDDNHIYDTAATLRVDLTSFWNVKTEAHFMDGYGGLGTPRGFYARSNRGGFEPTTKMLVIRTGISF